MSCSPLNIKKAFIFLAITVLAACGSDSAEEGSFEIQGAVEKGPFIVDSTVTINQLTDSGNNTSETTLTSTTDDLGSFNFSTDHSGLLQISASGYYRNEISGELSQGTLTLRSLYNVTQDSQQQAYINLLTHITSDRILTLVVNQTMAFNDALAQAEAEFLTAFSSVVPNGSEDNFTQLSIFESEGTQGSSYLLAVSSIMYQYAINLGQENNTNPDAELSLLVNQLKADFGTNGSFNNSEVLLALKNTISQVNPDQVSSNINEWISGKDEYVALDINEYLDSDLDGEFNVTDLDDDNDGYSDEVELSEGTSSFDASITPNDQDKDGLPDSTDDDRDGDGVANEEDDLPDNASEKLDTDGDNIGDLTDLDDDNDNWLDLLETACGTDPLDKDSTPIDTDGDSICNVLDDDDDNDNWADTVEATCSTSSLDNSSTPMDTDGDGTCNVLDEDDDNDNWSDALETLCSTDSLDNTSTPTDTDNDTSCDAVDSDDDNDGYSDDMEISAGTNPLNANETPTDTDGDFLPDDIDTDIDGDTVANEEDIDGDGDGLIEIYTLEQLNWIRHDLTGSSQHNGVAANTSGCSACNGYELMNDLDFDTNQDGALDSNDDYFDSDGDGSNQGWLAIGAEDAPFAAIFEGNQHSILNLYMNRSDYNSGFFARVGGSNTGLSGTIKNLSLGGDLMSVSLKGTAGALVGYLDNSVVDNCSSTGPFTASSSYSGGLVGYAENESIIRDSYTTGNVTGNGELGGLLGYAYNKVQVINSYATGDVSSASGYVGGLVSYIEDAVIIKNSYATGSVSANSSSVGGLVGTIDDDPQKDSLIINSYASGDVSGTDDVGGLVGEIYVSGHIYYSYATGNVTGTSSNVGGLVGLAKEAVISTSYATGNVGSINSNNVGGLVGRVYSSSFITTSFATGNVQGSDAMGGLVGNLMNYTDRAGNILKDSPEIHNSYSTGLVSGGTNLGGLVGQGAASTVINNSYWASDASGQVAALGNDDGVLTSHLFAATLNELKCPTGANDSSCSANELFTNWQTVDHDNDVITDLVAPWQFNSSSELPTLVFAVTLDFDRDGDGVNNPGDVYPDDASETLDTDGDNIGNNADDDDDGDGYSDGEETDVNSDPLDATKTPLDTDGDGYGNFADGDLFPDDSNEWADNDGDGTGDRSDWDDDNDSVHDSQDMDQDGDGLVEINTLAQLDGMRNDLAGTSRHDGSDGNSMGCNPCNGYELMYDLDFDTSQDGQLNGDDSYFDPDGDGSNKGWLPIGTDATPFVAIFEGNGHTLNNLYINRTTSYTGLFAQLGDSDNSLAATVQNLTFSGDLMTVTGGSYSGALAGMLDGSQVTNSHSHGPLVGGNSAGGLIGRAKNNSQINTSSNTGPVTATGDGGGLVGSTVNDVTISDSFASGAVSADGDYIGGLLGYGRIGITINDSYATGNVTAIGHEYIGGLVGVLEDDASHTSIINNSYATGNVSAQSYVGGLIGEVQGSGTLSNSHASGAITATGNNVGGLVGDAYSMNISSSYATGSVVGINNVGGLVGSVNGAFIAACFSQGSVEGSDAVGGLGGYILSATVSASYATGLVEDNGSSGGGLLGSAEKTTVNQSYWASDTTNMSNALGANYSATLNDTFGVLLTELKCPTSANDAVCAAGTLFSDWDVVDHDDDGGTAAISPWVFNSDSELPALINP